MSTMTQPCEHEDCKCVVTGGTEGAAYCSEECRSRDEAEEMESNCACGHPPCDAE